MRREIQEILSSIQDSAVLGFPALPSAKHVRTEAEMYDITLPTSSCETFPFGCDLTVTSAVYALDERVFVKYVQPA